MYLQPAFGPSSQISMQASTDYGSLVWKARLGKVLSMLLGRTGNLLDLQEKLRDVSISSRHYVGICNVPINRIQGSENRARDYNSAFKPLVTQDSNRWESVAVAQLNNVPLPPVELIKVGEIYYVRDGHHRISAAKELGIKFVEAEVIVWEINAKLPKEKQGEKTSAYSLHDFTVQHLRRFPGSPIPDGMDSKSPEALKRHRS